MIATIVMVSQAVGGDLTPAFAQAAQVQCSPAGTTASPPSVRPPAPPDRDDARSGVAPGQVAGVQPSCPEGQVPLVKPLRPDSSGVMKGNPLLRPQTDLRGPTPDRTTREPRHFAFDEVYGSARRGTAHNPSCDGIYHESELACYYYGTAAARRPMDGAGMSLTVNRPRYVGDGGFGHTLAEISIHGGGADGGDIVEIGWNVSTHQYSGSPDPHLFVFHWLDWQGTCYDGCGWVQVSRNFFPGQNLGALVGSEIFIGYAVHEGNWWAWVGDEWIGYFPASEWDNRFTKAAAVQWFGEVASRNGIPPQTEMGNGVFPTVTIGARLRNLCDYDAPAKKCTNREQQVVAVHPETAAKYYGAKLVGASDVRYGGPGR
jgi:Neprosin